MLRRTSFSTSNNPASNFETKIRIEGPPNQETILFSSGGQPVREGPLQSKLPQV